MKVAVVGGGPAGLRAAEAASEAGALVTLFEGKPSVGRKFLVAGKGGLNLTHEEPLPSFAGRYAGHDPVAGRWEQLLERWGPAELRAWVGALGVETFVATSGRVYPRELKSAALLRRWVHRLRGVGVRFQMRERLSWLERTPDGKVRLEFAAGEGWAEADAAVLALGGGSWPETGSDGGWVPLFESLGVRVRPLQASNCGWEVEWPRDGLAEAEGQPLKNVAGEAGGERVTGELLVTKYGLEGGVMYRLGRAFRESARPSLLIDFKPESSAGQLARRLDGVRVSLFATAMQRWKIPPAAQWILTHFGQARDSASALELAERVKHCEVPLVRPRPLAEAISTAGGVCWSELDADLMLQRLPGVFLAGEMIDWDAPTGGYLLQGAFSTGTLAGQSAAAWAARC